MGGGTVKRRGRSWLSRGDERRETAVGQRGELAHLARGELEVTGWAVAVGLGRGCFDVLPQLELGAGEDCGT